MRSRPGYRVADRLGGGLFVALTGITLVFLVLPIVGIFVHTTPGKLVDQLSNPVVRDAFIVSLKTSVEAQVLILVFGTPTALLLATRRFPGHSVAITQFGAPVHYDLMLLTEKYRLDPRSTAALIGV